MAAAKSYTLFDLNEHIRRVLALNLPDALWVSAEIAQVSESRGHYFLSLVQKGDAEDSILAQAEAVIWQQNARQIQLQLGKLWQGILQAGVEVLLKVRVEFHERYGLKLLVQDIDPAYTLGKLEMARRGTIEKLTESALLTQNRQLPLPDVLQRIAVLSSRTAAGFQDFWKHLQGNPYGYTFQLELFPVAVQGEQAEQEVLAQLKKISRQRDRFDGLVVIRGGGARLDLSVFDSLAVCAAMAQLTLPVFTGIGHDSDETVLDLVAHTALKTPTAVADFLLNHNARFESKILQLQAALQDYAKQHLETEALKLNLLQQQTEGAIAQKLRSESQQLQHTTNLLPLLLQRPLRESALQLQQQEALLNLLSVESTLQRGFTLTTRDGKIVRSATSLQPGDRITTRFPDGEIESAVFRK